MHFDTDVVIKEFLVAGIYRFDTESAGDMRIVCRAMAGEIAESRDIMAQITNCQSLGQAQNLAATFLSLRGK